MTVALGFETSSLVAGTSASLFSGSFDGAGLLSVIATGVPGLPTCATSESDQSPCTELPAVNAISKLAATAAQPSVDNRDRRELPCATTTPRLLGVCSSHGAFTMPAKSR